jgi:hypothetical protein
MTKFKESVKDLLRKYIAVYLYDLERCADLFTAVEQDDIGTVRTLLQRPIDINS